MVKIPAYDKYLITFEHIPSPNFGIMNAIIRDDRGFLWFGTTRGLCKYDGYQVRVLANGLSLNTPQQVVTSIIPFFSGDDRSLLLGTGKGLWTLNLKTEQFTPFLTGMEFSESRIIALVEDPTGIIWIGTNSQGLFSYNRTNGELQRFSTDNGLSDNKITSLLLDHSGRLWIGTLAGGLNVLDQKTSHIEHFRKSEADARMLRSDHITSLCENDDKELWIGTDEGLNVLNFAKQRLSRLDLPSKIRNTIMAMTRDHSGKIWIAASDLGLYYYFNGSFTHFATSNDVNRSLNTIRVLYQDPVATSGANLLLWIGTRSGVNKVFMSPNPFSSNIRSHELLQMDRGGVLSLCEDRRGTLWVGLWGGGMEALQRSDGKYHRIAHFERESTNPFSLPNNDVEEIVEDRNGVLWMGTSRGLASLDNHRKQMHVDRHAEGDSTSLLSDEITRIYNDRSGTIWIGTARGFSQLIQGPSNHFKNYPCDSINTKSGGGGVVSDILEDEGSSHWVATYGNGMMKLGADGSTITRFVCSRDSLGTGENWIYNFVEGQDGVFWLSTKAGLVSFDPPTGGFQHFSISQLNDAHIFGIVVDQKGNLWLSTSTGLAEFSPKSQTFRRFDHADGMPFTELLSRFSRSSRGTLFVGGLDGFTEFCPESVTTTSPPPEIVITGFSLLNKELPSSFLAPGVIHLSHDQNFFSFSFAALDYVNPQQNRFAYKMVGVDKQWIDAGGGNYARYTHLDPGDYLFQVRGCNSNNVWNESGTSVSIIISPPYWQTWWFRILVAGLGGVVIYAAYRYKVLKLLEVERLRLRIADDLHDDIGSNLSAIAMVSRAIRHAPELTSSTKRKLAEIYDTAITTSEGMKDIVWFIKPKNDTIDDLLLRMKDTASSLLTDIGHDFIAPQDDSLLVTIEFKRNFFLAFKEILTNVVKHASAHYVHIEIHRQDGILAMLIQDDGRGFTPPHIDKVTDRALNAARRGNGFESLKTRARHLGGECIIASQPGKGTTITFSGKLRGTESRLPRKGVIAGRLSPD